MKEPKSADYLEAIHKLISQTAFDLTAKDPAVVAAFSTASLMVIAEQLAKISAQLDSLAIRDGLGAPRGTNH